MGWFTKKAPKDNDFSWTEKAVPLKSPWADSSLPNIKVGDSDVKNDEEISLQILDPNTEPELNETPESVPLDDNETLEWNFDEAPTDFLGTGYLEENLRLPIEEILSRYTLPQEMGDKILSHLTSNENLEEVIKTLEIELRDLGNKYAESLGLYFSLRSGVKTTWDNEFTDTFEEEYLEAEYLDSLEPSAENPDSVQERLTSNTIFFTMESLEEKRHWFNVARKRELYGLLGSVPFQPEDSATAAVQDLIGEKLRGIEEVENIAFHVYGADPGTTPEVFMEDLPVGREFYPDASLYYKLVDQMGFDPIELYREDMKIKHAGGDYSLPRATLWSTSINEEWEAIQATLNEPISEDEEALVSAEG